MPTVVRMPALSPTMEAGALNTWLVKEGDRIASGDVIAEIETDKATMEVEAVDEGVLAKILVPAGSEDVPVNAPIAVLLAEGEDESALEGFDPAQAADGPSQAAQPPAAATRTEPARPEPARAEQARPEPKPAPARAAPPAAPAPAAASEGGRGNGQARGRIFASPLARRLAAESGLDLARIHGSGPHGRIVKRDIEAAREAGMAAAEAPPTAAPEAAPAAAPAPAPQPAAAPAAPARPEDLGFPEGSFETVKLDSMRRTVARRLTHAMQSIPHYYLTIDCAIDALLGLRKELNARDETLRLSVNDFVIRASALALRKVPEVNSSWTESAILRHKHADIAVAVAIESGGLITPIIREADAKGLAEIARLGRDLAERARARKLKPEEYQGGTFTVSNLGMFGIREFTAVINPPHAAILAVGRAEPRPVVRAGELKVATVMSCTLSCDHRLIDGAVGARFLQVLKGYLEDPMTMLL